MTVCFFNNFFLLLFENVRQKNLCFAVCHKFKNIRSYSKVNHITKSNHRFNPINIQMLSQNLHNQIFGSKSPPDISSEMLNAVITHLTHHNLWGMKTPDLPDVDFKLPLLHNCDILEHFRIVSEKLLDGYYQHLLELVQGNVPLPPQMWDFTPGWTCYNRESGKSHRVEYPDDPALVFDVEVCMQEGNYPTIATALSKDCWYLWCSERLVNEHFSWSKDVTLSDLIPMETNKKEINLPKHRAMNKKLIIGHNVGFDRTFVKEQYFLEQSQAKFLDTMSLHISISGLTGMQRSMSLANKKKNSDNAPNNVPDFSLGWSYISSLNNLADVYNLYCDRTLKKAERELFVKGRLSDVKEKFQEAATYCANDTLATYHVLQKVMPLFLKRFPHPVTLVGLLEMSSTYLPVNQNWERYIYEAESTYEDLQKELKLSLMHLANNACSLLTNHMYKQDPWLWDLDWSVQTMKFRKETIKVPKKGKRSAKDITDDTVVEYIKHESDRNGEESQSPGEISGDISTHHDSTLKNLYDSVKSLRKIRPFLPGYPAWYRELWDKSKMNDSDWEPGPYLLSTQMRCVPKLMHMTWDGFPLHYNEKHGWGYLVPKKHKSAKITESTSVSSAFPILNFLTFLCNKDQVLENNHTLDSYWSLISEPRENKYEESSLWNSILKKDKLPEISSGQISNSYGPHEVGIEGCLFYCLPHKDGPHKRVGNPLSKDFLSKIEDGTLRTFGAAQADRALLLSKMLSYWKNARDRIMSQMVVCLNHEELSHFVKKNVNYDVLGRYGAILPRVVPAGTVTRRAVEPTWLTASNAYEDRVGSELKSMVQAPPGYHFVGADVDSQELWLAAIFGDSKFSKLHGCTAFGWMTLQGKKSSGTDMHSKTAASVGISRDQAKVLNYARIYGAGKSFAQRLLMQFNHRLTLEEAKSKVRKIYSETKGVQKEIISEDQMTDNEYIFVPGTQRRVWVGGSESHMFNKLEDIALSSQPQTPALGCRISRALEPKAVDKNFMTSRINWVVQSSAVDFLHLMLVCMKWLFVEFDIKGRLSISIHDEIRYLVQSEDRYRAALALQITNLLTRSFFAAKLGMNDIPQSVAFFSSVDVDTVLRKEVNMDSKTPSNPHGLEKGYGIPIGESLDIFDVLQKTHGDLSQKNL